MMPASVAAIVVLVLVALGAMIGWLFRGKHEADKQLDMENNLRVGIDRALERARNAEKKYLVLANKIDSARTPDDYQRLWEELRGVVPNSPKSTP